MLGRMAEENSRAEAREALGDGVGLEVRALHLVAEIEQHFGDAAHAGAADADEVDEVDAAHAIVHAALASRRHAQIGEARRRIDVACRARRPRHLEQARAIGRELDEVRAQPLGR